MRRILLVALLLCGAGDAGLLAKYLADDSVLENVIDIPDDLPPSQKVITLVDYIESHVAKTRTTDESFLPGLAILRPTARQVLENGGDCADRSRLLIELLKREGVSASKVALHDRAGVSRHAVVSAHIEDEDEAMVIDALYGMYFPRPQGGYYSVWDIRNDESILVNRVRVLGPTKPDIQTYPIGLYTYVAPKSINWNKSAGMRQLYRLLSAVVGSQVVDALPRPSIVEDPVLLTLVGALGAQVMLIAGVLVVARQRGRRGRTTTVTG